MTQRENINEIEAGAAREILAASSAAKAHMLRAPPLLSKNNQYQSA